jgi:hypothetical protein
MNSITILQSTKGFEINYCSNKKRQKNMLNTNEKVETMYNYHRILFALSMMGQKPNKFPSIF